MIAAIVGYSLSEGAPLPQSVTPFLGAPPSYEYQDFAMETVGDPKAKAEAKRLIMTSKITELVPPAFDEAVVEIVVDDNSVGTEAALAESNVSVSAGSAGAQQQQQQFVPSTASDVVGEDSIAAATTASAVAEESVVVTTSSQQFPDDAFE
jgi:hypothetical protein